MKAIVITPERANTYRATANGKQSFGKTVGEAIDSIYEELEKDDQNTVVYVQELKGDEFFTDEQIKRLTELMEKWRFAQNKGESLCVEEQKELEDLIDAELEGAGQRAKKIFGEIK